MLNSILNLTPLTLLEVASKRVIREATQWSRMHTVLKELPYWFFQGMHSEGEMLIASPAGHTELISALDVMNVIPMEPIRTLAVPPSRFKDLGRHERGSLELYAPASVVSAMRSRWGFEYRVLFDDEALRTSSTWLAPLAPGERERLKPLTRRTRMPVSSMSSANWSADAEPKKIERHHAKACKHFFSRALSPVAVSEASHG